MFYADFIQAISLKDLGAPFYNPAGCIIFTRDKVSFLDARSGAHFRKTDTEITIVIHRFDEERMYVFVRF